MNEHGKNIQQGRKSSMQEKLANPKKEPKAKEHQFERISESDAVEQRERHTEEKRVKQPSAAVVDTITRAASMQEETAAGVMADTVLDAAVEDEETRQAVQGTFHVMDGAVRKSGDIAKRAAVRYAVNRLSADAKSQAKNLAKKEAQKKAGEKARRKAAKTAASAQKEAVAGTGKSAAKSSVKTAEKTAVKAGSTAAKTASGAAAGATGAGILVSVAVDAAMDKRCLKRKKRMGALKVFAKFSTGQAPELGRQVKEIVLAHIKIYGKWIGRGVLVGVLLALVSFTPIIMTMYFLVSASTLAGSIIQSPYKILFGEENTVEVYLTELEDAFKKAVEKEKAEPGACNSSEVIYTGFENSNAVPNNHNDILMVYVVKYWTDSVYGASDGGMSDATELNRKNKKNLKSVFDDMCSYETEEKNAKKIIRIKKLSYRDMMAKYNFTPAQIALVNELVSAAGSSMDEKTNASVPGSNPSYPKNGMKIPLFYQYQGGWENIVFGGGNIGSSGCSVTCLAMVISYLNQNTTTPADVVKWSGPLKYYVPGAGASWQIFPDAAAQFGLKCRQPGKNIDAVCQELKAGKPVIASMGPGRFTRQGHFIVLRGIDENGKILVNDPNDSSVKNFYMTSFSPESIDSEALNYWVFSK